jgi:hypothetical protein
MQKAQQFGFYNKGIKDPKFINSICQTNMDFRSVDKKLHVMKVKTLDNEPTHLKSEESSVHGLSGQKRHRMAHSSSTGFLKQSRGSMVAGGGESLPGFNSKLFSPEVHARTMGNSSSQTNHRRNIPFYMKTGRISQPSSQHIRAELKEKLKKVDEDQMQTYFSKDRMKAIKKILSQV